MGLGYDTKLSHVMPQKSLQRAIKNGTNHCSSLWVI